VRGNWGLEPMTGSYPTNIDPRCLPCYVIRIYNCIWKMCCGGRGDGGHGWQGPCR
jgi:hypothetical protein